MEHVDCCSEQEKVIESTTELCKFNKLIKDKLTDVDITINDKIFKCHIVLLKRTSKYFVSGCEFKEKVGKNMKFNLSDSLKEEDFKYIMDYLYDRENFKINNINCKSVIIASSFLQMEELLKLSRIEMVNIANEKCDGDTYEFMNLYFEKWIKSRMPWRVSRNFKRIQNIESLEFQYCLRLPANRLMKLLSLNDYLNIYESYILRLLLEWRELNLSSATLSSDFRNLIMYIKHNKLTESENNIIHTILYDGKKAISYANSINSLKMSTCEINRRKSPVITMIGIKGIYTIQNHRFVNKRYSHYIQPVSSVRKKAVDKWFGRGQLLIISNDGCSLFSNTQQYDAIDNKLKNMNIENGDVVCAITYGQYDILVAKKNILYYGKSNAKSDENSKSSLLKFVCLKYPYNRKTTFFTSHNNIVYMYNSVNNYMYMIKVGDKDWNILPDLLREHHKPCIMAMENGIYVFAGCYLQDVGDAGDSEDMVINKENTKNFNGLTYKRAAEPEFYSIEDNKWKSCPISFSKQLIEKECLLPWENYKIACDAKQGLAFFFVGNIVMCIKCTPGSLYISQHSKLCNTTKVNDVQLHMMNMPRYFKKQK